MPRNVPALLLRRSVAALALLALLSRPAPAGADVKRQFDLPAGEAAVTLRQFSAQANLEIMFPADSVSAVRTNAVQGAYTVREALGRLLANTGLTVIRDEKTGARMIRPAARPQPSSRSEPTTHPDPANPMKKKKLLTALTGWLALALAPASGQTTGSPAPAPQPAAEEKTIELSPFEVTSDRDTGFAATSSLAGGRLATELRDTPVAYSVMTREFIDALEITDLLEATSWSTGNTEPLAPGSGGGPDFFSNTGQYSTRGFISTAQANNGGNRQRNFFPMYSYGDTYNLERFDFGRGPNSILFGNGTLGGVSSSMTKRAKTDRPFQTIKTRVQSNQGLRGELDVNQPLLGGKAAVRASALWSDGEGWRDQEFDKRKAAFLTATWKPFQDTEIRLEGEYFKNARRSGTLVVDRFAGWDGVTTYNAVRPVKTLPGNAAAIGVDKRGANYYVFDPFGPANAIMNYQDDPVTRTGGGLNTPIAGFTQVGPVFGTADAPLLHTEGMPAGRFDTAIANSFFRPIDDEFSTVPDAPGQIQYFRDLQLTVSQRLGEHLFFELAGDVNTSDQFINGPDPVNSFAITYIDINQVLPNGTPNPNFLQPYTDANLQRNRFAHNNRNFRAAAAWVVPENRFGKFALNVLGGTNHRERNQDYRFLTLNEGADHRQWGHPAQQAVKVRHYWNAPGRPAPGGWGQSGRDLADAPVNFIDPVTGVSKQIQPRWTVDNNRADTQALDTSDFDYVLASLNAKFFNDRLVVIGAVRHDTYKFAVDIQKNRGDYPLDWDGTHRLMRPDAPADYQTLTFQPRDAAGVPNAPVTTAINRPRIAATGDRNPLFLNDRFQDDFNPPNIEGSEITRSVGTVLHLFSWLNPSVNYAETFNPPTGTPRINGQLKQPTVAKGTDYGLRMELFERRLDLNFTYYEAEEINATDGTTLSAGTINNLINANVKGDKTATGTNAQGVPEIPLVYRDSQSLIAQGFEVEVAYNPTKAIRLTGNYSKPKTGSSNRQVDTLGFIASNSAVFRQIILDAGGLVDSANVASVDTSIPDADRSPDVQQAVDAYNTIFQFQNTWTGRGATLDDSQSRANVFADYEFQSGWLKRLRVGAGVRWYGKTARGNRANDTIVNPGFNPALPVNATTNPLTIDDPAVDGSTPVHAPSYSIVTGTLAYSWKWRDRDFQANLVINNLLDDRGPLFFNTALRPKGGDYTSPARETVLNRYAYKQPINFSLSLTVKL